MFKKDNSNIEKKLDEIIIAIKDLNNSILNLKMNETNEAYNQNIYRGNMYQFTDMLSQTLKEINSKIEDRIIYLKEQQ
ncbi:troponin C [Campylobacter hominis]|uniref:Troponin C n=2 Tax=Campylobacter hominis TaxID=76517 RepID=A7HZR0_CAMHC|nr:troponin C [Campylobacter hominis ATCC BAA-381]SUW84299.1 troponin C [Campylobacter hominis]